MKQSEEWFKPHELEESVIRFTLLEATICNMKQHKRKSLLITKNCLKKQSKPEDSSYNYVNHRSKREKSC